MEQFKIPPHLSAEEHAVLAAEEQLIQDGRIWLKRALALYTQTPKVKIWVPVVGSMLLTGYYLYTLHARSAAAAAPAPTATVQPAPAVVAIPDNPRFSPERAAIPVASAAAFSSEPASTVNSELSNADLLEQAQQAHANQQYAQEAQLLRQSLDRFRSPRGVCPEIGMSYERAGDGRSALAAFKRCATLEPANLDTLNAFAYALQSKSDFNGAAILYRQVLRKDPGNLDAQGGTALLDLRENHLSKADAAAHAILRAAPANTDALLIEGLVAWRQGRLADAEQVFSAGVKLDPRRPDFEAFLGRIADAQHRSKEALQHYQKALALNPGDADIMDRRDRLQGAH
jgi:tetratricopeptide (TPR) repeat protein